MRDKEKRPGPAPERLNIEDDDFEGAAKRIMAAGKPASREEVEAPASEDSEKDDDAE